MNDVDIEIMRKCEEYERDTPSLRRKMSKNKIQRAISISIVGKIETKSTYNANMQIIISRESHFNEKVCTWSANIELCWQGFLVFTLSVPQSRRNFCFLVLL